MDKKIAKKRNRYCIDEKINRQVRRARLRTKTGIIIFLSSTLIAAVLGRLIFLLSGIAVLGKYV